MKSFNVLLLPYAGATEANVKKPIISLLSRVIQTESAPARRENNGTHEYSIRTIMANELFTKVTKKQPAPTVSEDEH